MFVYACEPNVGIFCGVVSIIGNPSSHVEHSCIIESLNDRFCIGRQAVGLVYVIPLLEE